MPILSHKSKSDWTIITERTKIPLNFEEIIKPIDNPVYIKNFHQDFENSAFVLNIENDNIEIKLKKAKIESENENFEPVISEFSKLK